MTVVTREEVLAGYRGPSVTDSLLETYIGEAERIIAKRLGPLVDWVLLSEGNRADLVSVITRAVSEFMNSPQGPYLLETEASYSYQVFKERVRSWITITPEMWGELGVTAFEGVASAYGFVLMNIPEGSPRRSWDYVSVNNLDWSHS